MEATSAGEKTSISLRPARRAASRSTGATEAEDEAGAGVDMLEEKELEGEKEMRNHPWLYKRRTHEAVSKKLLANGRATITYNNGASRHKSCKQSCFETTKQTTCLYTHRWNND